jgi:hypothetical protein
MTPYFGSFQDYDQMLGEWGHITEQPIPTAENVLFAAYGGAPYEGAAIVVFTHEGKLYEVNGGHCSCYGLSAQNYNDSTTISQWEPEETTWKTLAMRTLRSDEYEEDAREAFENLVKENV